MNHGRDELRNGFFHLSACFLYNYVGCLPECPGLCMMPIPVPTPDIILEFEIYLISLKHVLQGCLIHHADVDTSPQSHCLVSFSPMPKRGALLWSMTRDVGEKFLDQRRFDQPWWHRGDEPWYYPTRPTRVRLGQGRYRLLNPSDAELNCDFPDSEHIISNVVWVRADLAEPDVRSLYRLHKERGRDAYSKVTGHVRGSTLYLHRVTPLDTGLYRCLATSRGPGGRVQTVFQDVHFVPDIWHNHRP
nr:unnamed protein product [Timema californicum]